MSTPVPITLSAQPVDVSINATDLNALLQLIAANITASINQQVSFFLQVPSNPGTFVGDIIYNTSQMAFQGWNTGSGKYLPITAPAVIGQITQTFNQGDNPQAGFIQLNGRLISGIQGISANQVAILNGLFPGGSLPNIQTSQLTSGLPQQGSFSDISNPAVVPPSGQIGALTFGSTYNPPDEQALASNTEVLRGAVQSTQDAITALISQSEALLDAILNTGGPTIYASVYCGPP